MQRYKWLGGAALVPTIDDGDYVLYYDAMVEIGRLTALACERQEIIEEQAKKIAALKAERNGYLAGQQQMQDTCSRLQNSTAKYAIEVLVSGIKVRDKEIATLKIERGRTGD